MKRKLKKKGGGEPGQPAQLVDVTGSQVCEFRPYPGSAAYLNFKNIYFFKAIHY